MFCDLTKILIALPATLSQNSYYESKPPIQGGRIGNLKVNNDLVFSAPNQCLGRLQLGHCTNWIQAHFFKWAVPGLFFFIFVFSIQLTINVQYKFFLMTGFEPQTSGIGSERSTNWATPLPMIAFLYLQTSGCVLDPRCGGLSSRDIFSPNCVVMRSNTKKYKNTIWSQRLLKTKSEGKISSKLF